MIQHSRRIISLCSIVTALAAHPAQARTAEPAATGWTITQIAQEGVGGFTNVGLGAIGDGGHIALAGTLDGIAGLYTLRGGEIVTAAVVGAPVEGGLGTLTVVDTGSDSFTEKAGFAVDAQGGIYFRGRASADGLASNLGLSVFRAHNGVIARVRAANGRKNWLGTLTAGGEWLSETGTGVLPRQFFITSGAAITPALTVQESAPTPANGCVEKVLFSDIALNGAGSIAYVTRESVFTVSANPSECTYPIDVRHTVHLNGAVSRTVASTNHVVTLAFDPAATQFVIERARVNDSAQVLFTKVTYTASSTTRQFIRNVSGGDTVLASTVYGANIPNFSETDMRAPHFDNFGRLSFDAAVGAFVGGVHVSDPRPFGVYAGPNVLNDRVVQQGEALFGQPVTGVFLQSASASRSAVNDNRRLLIRYAFASGVEGLALASKGTSTWVNPAGGDWSTASNWLPAQVPDETANTLFELNATYNVSVGAREADSASVTRGSVTFSGATLELASALNVGSSGALSIPQGFVSARQIFVGDIPDSPAAATLNLSGATTIVSDTEQTVIGGVGDGQLTINGATLYSVEARIGSAAPGTVTVQQAGVWNIGTLTLAQFEPAYLTLRQGAFAVVDGDVNMGTLDGSRATVHIVGRSGNGGQSSLLSAGRDIIAGASASTAQIDANTGGALQVERNLVLAQEPGSSATLALSGAHPDGTESRAFVTGECLAGVQGDGRIWVSDGARLQCAELSLGVLAGGKGLVVARSSLARASTIQAGALCIGASALCGTAGGGRVILIGNSVISVNGRAVVGSGGIIEGGGTLVTGADALILDGGSLSPGLGDDLPLPPIVPLRAPFAGAATTGAQPGTLTISGSLSLSNTAVITIDLTGPTSYDKLVVLGGTTLNGKLVLNFSNGYAPKTGDVFEFLQGATGGQFDSVEIKGLATGFTYTVTTVNGTTTLTATNDGVPTTQRDPLRVLLPLVRR